MTADKVEMLSLPEKVVLDRHLPTGVQVYGYDADAMRAYARDCVDAVASPLVAENRALRADIDRLRRALANARLIAAAHDLLAALRELRYACTDKAEAMADAAIAKATGMTATGD